jgi:hypothetical protein
MAAKPPLGRFLREGFEVDTFATVETGWMILNLSATPIHCP